VYWNERPIVGAGKQESAMSSRLVSFWGEVERSMMVFGGGLDGVMGCLMCCCKEVKVTPEG
jgi:hypothetical protein